MTDDDLLRSLFKTATSDLRAPRVQVRPRLTVVAAPGEPPPPQRRRRRSLLLTAVAATAGAAATVGVFLGLGVGAKPSTRVVAGSRLPAGGAGAAPATAAGPAVLYHLASAVRALRAPSGRYAVQIERQTEAATSYLKATIIDSRTGDTWTYQRGAGVPSVLPMAPAFSPTEAQMQSSDPTDPPRLRAALIAQASAADTHPIAPQTGNDLAVTQAIDTLWNPLVQPALRAALVWVIASSPGVTTDPRASDAVGRKSIEISYDNAALGLRLSVYLDPTTGVVLESSQQPYTSAASRDLAGKDVYLDQYWTDTAPTVDPLNG